MLVPDGVSDDQAAGLLLQGLTAHALVHRCARLEPGETVVVEAAAGGTGSLAVQLAKRHGARVIGLASSPEKRELVERLGADATVDSRAEDMKAAILEANGGDQVDAVLQMSGGAAFDAQLRTLAPFGRMVTFGIASRDENEVRTGHLMRNSRAVIGFWLVHLFRDPAGIAAAIERAVRRRRGRRPRGRHRRRPPALGGTGGPRGARGADDPGQVPARPRLVSSLATHASLQRARALRADSNCDRRARLRGANAGPGAGDPRAPRRARRDRPGADGHRARPPPSACRSSSTSTPSRRSCRRS